MHKKSTKSSVFYDPIGRRWNWFKQFIRITFLTILLSFVVLALNIVNEPHLPETEAYDFSEGEIYSLKEDKLQRLPVVNSRYIALTFDDGPDPRNTPQMLSILKKYNVPATFFVVGANANSEPDLLLQIFYDGHEIGNHTYTHVNSEKVSPAQFRLELNATQQLLESRLGVKTKLFRAPYSDDREPESNSQLKPIKEATQMGYVSIGMGINPDDWKAKSSDEILSQIENSLNNDLGHIILLHDGGDYHEVTIESLPLIIEKLQAQGYIFVTVSRLMNWESPYVSADSSLVGSISNALSLVSFSLMNHFNDGIKLLALASAFIGIVRFIVVTIFAIIDKRRKSDKIFPINFFPKVAAIVPAYNEEKVVAKTVDSLLSSDYPNLEVVVIDDGSKDNTHFIVENYFAGNPRVKNLRKENGGKSSAINYGLTQTDAPIVIILDADTIIQKDAIRLLARHFKNPNLGAVAGNAKVGNRVNFLTNLQAIEYITSQNLERRAFNVFNSIRVVAGAIGAWRRDLLLQSGGFTHDTLAEDTDMTLRILRMGYRIEYEPDAIAFTEAPQTIETFMKQRFRWMHGTFQAIWKHMDTLFNPKFGMMGIIAIPDVLIFQIFFPLFAPLMDLFLVTNIALTFINIYHHPTSYTTYSLQQALGYYIAFMLFDYAAAGMSFIMERKENRKLLLYLFFQRFVYRQLLYISAIRSTLSAIKGEKVGWGKFERTSAVPHTFSQSLAVTGS